MLLYLTFMPLVRGELSLDSLLAVDIAALAGTAGVFVVGYIYRLLRLRDLIFGWYVYEIQANLRDGLTQPFLETAFGRAVRDMDPSRVMPVFYHFVDNDESLKSKTNEIYENGLSLSSCADLFVVSAFGVVAYLVGYLWFHTQEYFFAAVIFLSLCILSQMFGALALSRHKRLGSEQVEVIRVIHSAALAERLRALAG
ncbi:hypothetical protein [Usitatibacter rugosus]|uniref:hypothetical protein n=1 Tax=Usitatibacter rugosus TaxID=2732067 RepID=UPI0014893C7B|nr:hypothetical protein [Usitatibacter rugosus]